MTDRESEGGRRLPFTFKQAALALGAAAVAFIPTAMVFNAAASYAEFNGVQSQIMMLAEQGKLTGKDGAPQPYVVKYKGQEFSVSVMSALRTQNGQYREAGGQVTQDSQTTTGQGAISSQQYSSGYVLKTAIMRVKGSDSLLRPFYNDGGMRMVDFQWEGAKPPKAPLSFQPTIPAASVQQAAPANPAVVPAPAPAPAG
jgi:hypothetical protein